MVGQQKTRLATPKVRSLLRSNAHTICGENTLITPKDHCHLLEIIGQVLAEPMLAEPAGGRQYRVRHAFLASPKSFAWQIKHTPNHRQLSPAYLCRALIPHPERDPLLRQHRLIYL